MGYGLDFDLFPELNNLKKLEEPIKQILVKSLDFFSTVLKDFSKFTDTNQIPKEKQKNKKFKTE